MALITFSPLDLFSINQVLSNCKISFKNNRNAQAWHCGHCYLLSRNTLQQYLQLSSCWCQDKEWQAPNEVSLLFRCNPSILRMRGTPLIVLSSRFIMICSLSLNYLLYTHLQLLMHYGWKCCITSTPMMNISWTDQVLKLHRLSSTQYAVYSK